MIKVASESQILNFFASSYSKRKFKYYSFYNSDLNKIITDQKLMLLPIDDRTATRAHGVFDVLYVKKRCIVNMQQHINRLYSSADSLSIIPPFSKQQAERVVTQVVQETIKHHITHDQTGLLKQKFVNEGLGIRLTISSGYGDLSVASIGKKSVLYIILFEPYISYEKEKMGVNQYIAQVVKSPKDLVHAKTIDYSHNALMANFSKERGGYQGIKTLQNGVLLEAASANIAFIFGKQFATPRFQTVIQGTTIKKLLIYVQQLVKLGVLEKISFRDITIEQAYKATEMIVLGGDKIVPVLSFNDHPITQTRGPMTKLFQDWYEQMNEKGTALEILRNI